MLKESTLATTLLGFLEPDTDGEHTESKDTETEYTIRLIEFFVLEKLLFLTELSNILFIMLDIEKSSQEVED
jgi:hypothetical protein